MNENANHVANCASKNNKKLFPQKLWDLINDERYNFCLRWSDDGLLVYLNRDEFENSYLKTSENQFHTQKAISFVRQMNMYGFRKVDDCYYENDNFKRGCKHLLKNMIRKHPNKASATGVNLMTNEFTSTLQPHLSGDSRGNTNHNIISHSSDIQHTTMSTNSPNHQQTLKLHPTTLLQHRQQSQQLQQPQQIQPQPQPQAQPQQHLHQHHQQNHLHPQQPSPTSVTSPEAAAAAAAVVASALAQQQHSTSNTLSSLNQCRQRLAAAAVAAAALSPSQLAKLNGDTRSAPTSTPTPTPTHSSFLTPSSTGASPIIAPTTTKATTGTTAATEHNIAAQEALQENIIAHVLQNQQRQQQQLPSVSSYDSLSSFGDLCCLAGGSGGGGDQTMTNVSGTTSPTMTATNTDPPQQQVRNCNEVLNFTADLKHMTQHQSQQQQQFQQLQIQPLLATTQAQQQQQVQLTAQHFASLYPNGLDPALLNRLEFFFEVLYLVVQILQSGLDRPLDLF